MRLIETIDPITEAGIFQTIQANNVFTWLTQDMAKSLDIDYYLGRSGDKTISVLYERLIDKTDVPLTVLANIITTKYSNDWERLYEALINPTYNRTENYNMREIETPNITKQTLTKENTDITTSNTANQNVNTFGFNSSESVPAQDSSGTSEQTVKANEDSNYTDTTESETGTRQLERSGNIGVTTNQQMLESEIELRKKNFYEIIMQNVDTILTLPLYNNKGGYNNAWWI